jgi:hypothetical protein
LRFREEEIARSAAYTPRFSHRSPLKKKAAMTPERRRQTQDALIELISEGTTKVAACRGLGIRPRSVTRWVERDAVFADRYVRARIEQAHSLADRVLEIADEPIGLGGMAEVQRNRLRVDALKWFCSKIAPRLYGQRALHDVTRSGGVVLLPALNADSVSQVKMSELPPSRVASVPQAQLPQRRLSLD